MELKNAASVCLISLFSATLVVLIARALDNQAASRLEPQLTGIAEELKALRLQGGVSAAADSSAKTEVFGDGLVVYYFHGNTRCPTCRSIEAQAHATVQTHFASALNDGKVIWKIVNYEESSAKPLAEKFQLSMPVIVLAKMKGGEIVDWKRLDRVWALVEDQSGFEKYVREEIEQMLMSDKKPETATSLAPGPAIPVPSADAVPSPAPPAIPIPK